jgi:hypothetical protein
MTPDESIRLARLMTADLPEHRVVVPLDCEYGLAQALLNEHRQRVAGEAFHEVAIKERDAERVRALAAELENEELRAKLARYESEPAPFPYDLIHAPVPFTVSDGRFSSPQRMGWHLVTGKGFTIGVLCDRDFYDQMQIRWSANEVLARRAERAQDQNATLRADIERRQRWATTGRWA